MRVFTDMASNDQGLAFVHLKSHVKPFSSLWTFITDFGLQYFITVTGEKKILFLEGMTMSVQEAYGRVLGAWIYYIDFGLFVHVC